MSDLGQLRLSYTEQTRGPNPIPWAERDLPRVVARPYFKVSDDPYALEGPAYDRDNNLYFVDVNGGSVMRLTPDKTLTCIHEEKGLGPAGIAIHKDGRIFVACLGDTRSGCIIAMSPDGRNRVDIIPRAAGYVPDDLVFDAGGGFYFTDFRGDANRLDGGVYYVPPDMSSITRVLPNMGIANGVALSEEGDILWATEFCSGRLHRVILSGPATFARAGASKTPYHFNGSAPDSMRTDAAGNAYVAMIYQGRVLVFNPAGFPIGQILLPGCEEGRHLRSTSLAFRPGTDHIVIVSHDDGDGGAMIFEAHGLARGTKLYSHQ